VGDDVYGEDPTVLAFQERVASLFGKEAALFVPSGTMGNQLAIASQTKRGDEVVIGEGAHVSFYESGAGPAISGVQFAVAGKGGLFTAEELLEVVKPPFYYHPRTSLVCVENTHNRAGGRVFPQRDAIAIAAAARTKGLAVHIDGARIWNAHVATGVSLRDMVAPFDTASVCFSKGLGAPVGSVLLGSRDVIRDAHRFRKMLGAGMRQVGILAAAASFALDHHLARLADDHRRAKELGQSLAKVEGVDVTAPETNIVSLGVGRRSAERVAEAAKARGVLLNPTGPSRLRAVFHLDVTEEGARLAADRLGDAIQSVEPSL
jgi:threonine aldolase